MSKRVSNKKGKQRVSPGRSYSTRLVDGLNRARVHHLKDGPLKRRAYYEDGTVLSAARTKREDRRAALLV